uniref:EF-hand domain-containing protein n=1 Tax=Chromera velia CCMP2878 TaxID=1169474 RepID=A0A0G4FVL0_9ALVE|eukprot:Cvel_18843.t1-p1 / transcript=Cvel_18843.t1 / gene=Cvel_18843 / organism=Chromera_velia_CCMP2878 / gene_product=hypothetical protein / transcript_product=hypothetical protein / location=Cvel_scaffold1584:5377-8929(+) / protein_length=489 / sequence_SO=supercontig / SO=protein_coding / is_pseudo=false
MGEKPPPSRQALLLEELYSLRNEKKQLLDCMLLKEEVDEFRQKLQRCFETPLAVWQHTDKNRDGWVSRWEFQILVRSDLGIPEKALSRRAVHELFRIFDLHGEGMLSREDFFRLCGLFKQPFEPQRFWSDAARHRRREGDRERGRGGSCSPSPGGAASSSLSPQRPATGWAAAEGVDGGSTVELMRQRASSRADQTLSQMQTENLRRLKNAQEALASRLGSLLETALEEQKERARKMAAAAAPEGSPDQGEAIDAEVERLFRLLVEKQRLRHAGARKDKKRAAALLRTIKQDKRKQSTETKTSGGGQPKKVPQQQPQVVYQQQKGPLPISALNPMQQQRHPSNQSAQQLSGAFSNASNIPNPNALPHNPNPAQFLIPPTGAHGVPPFPPGAQGLGRSSSAPNSARGRGPTPSAFIPQAGAPQRLPRGRPFSTQNSPMPAGGMESGFSAVGSPPRMHHPGGATIHAGPGGGPFPGPGYRGARNMSAPMAL